MQKNPKSNIPFHRHKNSISVRKIASLDRPRDANLNKSNGGKMFKINWNVNNHSGITDCRHHPKTKAEHIVEYFYCINYYEASIRVLK
jgi:hypothetical protein